MWHVTSAEVFTADNNQQPAAIIRRGEGGTYTIEIQPGRELPASTVPFPDDGVFASFDDALNYGLGN